MADVIQQNKGWFMAAGIALVIIGMAAIAVPLVASVAVEILFGWLFVISGIVMAVHSFRALGAGKCIFRLLAGILYVAVGVIFLTYPIQGVVALTLLLAILFLFEGIMKIAVAARLRPMPNWGWMLASGIAALVLSGIIWAGWPGSAAWMLGLLVGINLIFGGWTMVMLSTAPGK